MKKILIGISALFLSNSLCADTVIYCNEKQSTGLISKDGGDVERVHLGNERFTAKLIGNFEGLVLKQPFEMVFNCYQQYKDNIKIENRNILDIVICIPEHHGVTTFYTFNKSSLDFIKSEHSTFNLMETKFTGISSMSYGKCETF